jgi:hypothetical protein
MRKGLAAVLGLGLVLAVTSGALAAPATHHHHHPDRSQARVAKLRKEVHRLQRRLYDMTQARDGLKAALAGTTRSFQTSQEQLGAASQEVASLQQLLAQRTSERDAALGEVTALQIQVAQLQAAALRPLEVAEEQVRREVAWGEYEADANGTPYSHGELVALSAMDYVVGHVSTGAYGYLEIYGGSLPDATADAVLDSQAGICGHASLTFAAILEYFGYDVRSVQFYYSTPDGTPDSHIGVGVSYDGAWHYFDPTFGTYWTDAKGNAMSIEEIRNGEGTQHKDDVSFTNVIEDSWFGGDATAFITDPATTVDLDAQSFDS